LPDFNPSFRATGIGSVPFERPEEILDLILERLPEIPFWPQLTRRSPWEDMILQFAPGLPALKADPGARRVAVDPTADRPQALTAFYEQALSGEWKELGLNPDQAAGFFALAERVAREKGGVRRLKGQVTGPVTFCLAVKDQNGRDVIHDQELREAYALGLGIKGAWQVQNLPQGLDPSLVFLDEPALTGFGSAFMALEGKEAVGLLNAAMEPIHRAGGLTGVHVCGNTDWSTVLKTDLDVVNFDAAGFGQGFTLYPKEIQAFLERGGVIAWGIVPTLTYTGQETEAELIRRLEGLIDDLAAKGLPRSLIQDRSLLTTACGMGSRKPEEARRILDLLAGISRKMTGQA